MITKEKFIELVEHMLEHGGAWSVFIDKDGCILTYEEQKYEITEQMADIMFKHSPRKTAQDRRIR